MSKMLPLHRVSEALGFATEDELTTLLRLLPGLPFQTKKGVIFADPDLLADCLADRGVVVPGDLVATNPDDGEDVEDDEEGQDDEDGAQTRRRR